MRFSISTILFTSVLAVNAIPYPSPVNGAGFGQVANGACRIQGEQCFDEGPSFCCEGLQCTISSDYVVEGEIIKICQPSQPPITKSPAPEGPGPKGYPLVNRNA